MRALIPLGLMMLSCLTMLMAWQLARLPRRRHEKLAAARRRALERQHAIERLERELGI